MSLTSILQLPEIKKGFSEQFRRPSFPAIKPALLAPKICKDPSLVGTAYDYLFRIAIQHDLYDRVFERGDRDIRITSPTLETEWLNLECSTQKPFRIINSLWVAEYGALLLDRSDDVSIETKRAVQRIMRNSERFRDISMIDNFDLDSALDEVIVACLQLAKLDNVYRAGYIARDFEEVDNDDVLDVRALYEQTDFSLFNASTYCLLNPLFKASTIVGGADADLVLDRTLIDIKTVSKFSLSIDILNQLLGYLVLSRLAGYEGVRGAVPLDSLGIYFARYNYLYVFSVDEVIDEKSLRSFSRWFKKVLTQENGR